MKIGSEAWSRVIIDGARAFGYNLDRSHCDLFAIHARELLHWNKTINLTAITDPYEIAVKHFVDSLAPAGLISAGTTLLDIGSGGGFPGIPLKILIPTLSTTLIDASRKKVNFLKHVIRTLELEGTAALHIRAEDLAAEQAYQQRFDIIVSRALTDLATFVRQGSPLLSEKGVMMALKGKVDPTETGTLKTIGFVGRGKTNSAQHQLSIAVKDYELPLAPSKRSIITIRKAC